MLDNGQQVADRAGETIEPDHDQGFTGIALRIRALFLGGDPRIADQAACRGVFQAFRRHGEGYGLVKRHFLQFNKVLVSGRVSLSCRLVRKPADRAGGCMIGTALSEHDRIPFGPIPEANLLRSLAEICAQSGENRQIRPRQETSLIRGSGRQMDGRKAFPSLWRGSGSALVGLPRLNQACHNLVNELESLYKSCSTQCIGHG
jgi:hypothetical protein